MKRLMIAVLVPNIIVACAMADGILLPRPSPILPPNPSTTIKFHHVETQIDDPIAITKVDQVFVNPYAHEIEADYIFPLPDGAVLSRFTAWLDGRKMEAELLDAMAARRIYEDIVRQRKDPALLEYYGRGMYRLRVYPIPPYGETRIAIEYEQTLKSDNGLVEYIYPLRTERFSGDYLQECRIRVDLASFENIGTIYSPSHNMTILRNGPKSATINYRETNSRPDRDFKLYFARTKDDFGFHLMSHRETNSKWGYFIGIIAPPAINRLSSIPKNIVFVLDSSGSMRGEKMKQALNALLFVIAGLNPADKFNIIDFDDAVRPFRETLIPASKVNIDAAKEFTQMVNADGGTNMHEALNAACHMAQKSETPTYILFLTDGVPTVGITDIDRIAIDTRAQNEGRARIFVFGVGHDVNTRLLDRLAQENGGPTEYVLPEEDIESKVSRIAAKISQPAMTDLKLVFSNIRVDLVYPQPLPDLFYGSEIIVAGRYEGEGTANISLLGNICGKKTKYDYRADFQNGSFGREFIPLIWANRRVAYILDQIKINGSTPELVTELVELSKKFGIVTEYTSFLVTGDENYRAEQYQRLPAPEIVARVRDVIDSRAMDVIGSSAVYRSKIIQEQKSLEQLDSPGKLNIHGQTQTFSNITQVGDKGFFQQGSLWVQGDLERDDYDLKIKRFSTAYFQILEKNPGLGKYLALGDQVRLKIGKRVVQFDDNGQESISAEELTMLSFN